jgi:hypothetical protein
MVFLIAKLRLILTLIFPFSREYQSEDEAQFRWYCYYQSSSQIKTGQILLLKKARAWCPLWRVSARQHPAPGLCSPGIA